ncbi:DUF2249 domain-containing protein [Alkalibacillus aidingensis]|uniref:DUF2249 domain-containing protein n=1 Tax=Alkalibacillus aidingensis TaxID=2747607 RepID=UPI0016610F6A|nr:DUF2249 domain-containing protein [Alkalibacillus aidingensis]
MNTNNDCIELDVREDIQLGKEPFEKIMNAVGCLNVGQALVLHVPFQPVPLYQVMERKGFDCQDEEVEPDHWRVVFYKRVGED